MDMTTSIHCDEDEVYMLIKIIIISNVIYKQVSNERERKRNSCRSKYYNHACLNERREKSCKHKNRNADLRIISE